MSLIAEEDQVPELGDRITIVSKQYGKITGLIIYRDELMIRIKPNVSNTTSRRLYDFPMNPETGAFQDPLGVEQIIYHSKRSSPWYSLQLAVLPDSELLLYTSDPTPEKARIVNIISTDDEDALVIQRNGVETPERLDFNFKGPPPPLLYVEPTLSTESTEVISLDAEEEEPVLDLPPLEGVGAVVELARADQQYPEEDQLQDMCTSLLNEYPIEQHTNNRILTILKQQAATLLSLKQSVQKRIYTAATVLDAIQLTDEPLEAILPITTVRRALYLEDTAQETELYKAHNELETFGAMIDAQNAAFNTTSDSRGNRFARYLGANLATGFGLVGGTLSTPYIAKRVVVDQEVFRGPVESRTRGLVSDLPAGRHVYGVAFRGESKLKQRYIGNIGHQLYRLVGSVVLTNPEDGREIQVAPADVLDPLAYHLLPPSIARQRCTVTRTGVLLWDVQRSQFLRSRFTLETPITKRIHESNQIQEIDDSLELSEVLQDRIPSTFYQLSDHSFQSVLDELGLRSLELTPELLEVVSASLQKSQDEWTHAHDVAVKHAALPRTNELVVSSIADRTSPLLTSVESTPLLQVVSKQVQVRESSLQTLDLVLAEELLTITHRTRVPLWYGTAAGRPEELQTFLQDQQQIIESEQTRLLNLEDLSAKKELSYHAEPIINSCEHVKELEHIRGIAIKEDAIKLLDKFYQKYESGVVSNWIQCNVCRQDLICRHEILLLQESKQKTNTAVFQKTLRMEFMSLQYDGNYICKNCGIPIAEIEYDTGPEFDDNGHIMQGRSVLTDEPDVPLDALNLAEAIQDTELQESKMAEDKVKIYHIIRDLFESAGANPSDAIYKKCVNSIYNQLILTNSVYAQRIRSLLKTPPDDSVIDATFVAILSAAFVIAELQISEASLPIYITRQGCTFSREGIPRDKEGTGLFDYMICILLQMELETYPWTTTLWAGFSGEKRKSIVNQEVRYALREISKIPAVTDALHEAALKRESAVRSVESIPLFRRRTGAPSAITNREGFLRSVEQDPLAAIRTQVIGRTEAMSQDIIQSSHEQAVRTREDLVGKSKRLDGQCGQTKLSELGLYGFGIIGLQSSGAQQEIQLLRYAIPKLMQRDPSHSLGMSHFITPWSAHIHPPPAKVNVESLSFRLFLKACASGPHVGLPHEYGIDRICRRCGLRSPVEILNLAVEEDYYLEKESGEKGKALDQVRETLQTIATQKDSVAKEVLEDANISTDHDAFLRLQDQIHLRRKVDPMLLPSLLPWIDLIGSTVRDIPTLHQNWILFQEFFSTPIASEKERIAKFVPVSNLNRDYLRNITMQYITLVGKANVKAVQLKMNAFTAQFETIIKTETKALSTFLTSFVTPLKRICNGIESSVKGSKWIKGITFQHEEILNDLWKKHYKIVDAAIAELDNSDNEQYKTIVRTALNRYTNLTGSLLELLIHSVRISSTVRAEEFKDLVRWILLSTIYCVLDETSPFYEANTPLLRQTAAQFIGKYIFELFEAIYVQHHHINKSPAEITNAIEARKQQERQQFIKKQDKLASVDEKRADNLMKLFGLGDYSQGALKKKFTYDAEFFEFHRNQRVEYGLPEFSEDISAAAAAASGAPEAEEGGTFDEYIGAGEQDD